MVQRDFPKVKCFVDLWHEYFTQRKIWHIPLKRGSNYLSNDMRHNLLRKISRSQFNKTFLTFGKSRCTIAQHLTYTCSSQNRSRSLNIGRLLTHFFFHFSDVESVCTDCGVSPPWLLYLCIAFGILFLVMLIINVFLCSAMTCSCARTEPSDKEPSVIEEFDPYTRSWQGSQYGSR